MSLKSGGQNFTSKDVFFSILVLAMSREKEEHAIMNILMFYLYINIITKSFPTDYHLDLLWSIAAYEMK